VVEPRRACGTLIRILELQNKLTNKVTDCTMARFG
jgi:hypothetical protein